MNAFTHHWTANVASAKFKSFCDVTDNWIEERDPENEQGAVVTAYFDHADGISCDSSGDAHQIVPVLHEIHVQVDSSLTIYGVDRLPFDAHTVERIENHHTITVNGY